MDKFITFDFQRIEVIPVEAQADIGTHAGNELLNTQFDGLREAERVSRNLFLEGCLHIFNKLDFADGIRPLTWWFQSDDHICLVDTHRIISDFWSPGFGDNGDHLGEFQQTALDGFGHLGRGFQRDTWQSGDLDSEVSFVELRDEFHTEARGDEQADYEQSDGGCEH